MTSTLRFFVGVQWQRTTVQDGVVYGTYYLFIPLIVKDGKDEKKEREDTLVTE